MTKWKRTFCVIKPKILDRIWGNSCFLNSEKLKVHLDLKVFKEVASNSTLNGFS